MGSLSEQIISRLTLLVGDIARKQEESIAVSKYGADRASAIEGLDAACVEAQRGAPQTGSAQDGTYRHVPAWNISRVWSRRTTQRRGRGLCPPRGEKVAAAHN